MENPNKQYKKIIEEAQKAAQDTTPQPSSFEDRKRAWDAAKAEQSAKFDPKHLEQTELF